MAEDRLLLHVIGHIRTDFPAKFALPRQSSLVDDLTGRIVFEKEYRRKEALKGLEGFSHLWVIWLFSEAMREKWSPTVRPPRLGGNTRLGVFATRSPFRPNPIGLSCVKLEKIEENGENGPVIVVSGIDMMDNTPVLDIKPYLPFCDCQTDACGAFADEVKDRSLEVVVPPDLLALVPEEKKDALKAVLAQDPRPGYQDDPERIYGFYFADLEVRFTVREDTLEVVGIEQMPRKS